MPTKDQLEGMYKLMTLSYNANWQYRGAHTPFLEEAINSGKAESVAGHVWATMELWLNLRRLCPSLDSHVNSTEIYEILLIHDLGETLSGDVSLFEQVNNGVDPDRNTERDNLKKITSHVAQTQEQILTWFDEFEMDPHENTKLEIIIARWLGNLQGDHWCLTYGNNLPTYSESIGKIVRTKFVANSQSLIQILISKNHHKAAEEVRLVMQHHLEAINTAGIEVENL